MSLPLVIHSSLDTEVEFSTELLGACTTVFWCHSHCQLLSFGKRMFSMQLLRLVLGVVGVRGSISPLFAGPSFSSTKEILVGWGLLAGLPSRPPSHARALPGSTNFVGTNAQAHLLVMNLNVAKCNLCKVNLEAMLVSSFPSYCN